MAKLGAECPDSHSFPSVLPHPRHGEVNCELKAKARSPLLPNCAGQCSTCVARYYNGSAVLLNMGGSKRLFRRKLPAGELNTRLCPFTRCALQMCWEHCKPQAPGEEKGQPGWPWGLVTKKSPTPGVGMKKAGEQPQVVGVLRHLCLYIVICLRL